MADDTANSSVMDSLPGNMSANQYCLKWNNHKLNISNVFERLRANSQFCDLTLTSADQKFIKCHRLLLCAGSGYLEDILTENPSEHPTIVLSQIYYEEMRLLVDFMYSGEVSVATDKLAVLLEAARILKIKGLWESSGGQDSEEEPVAADHADKMQEEEEEEEVKIEPMESENKNEDTTVVGPPANEPPPPAQPPSQPTVSSSVAAPLPVTSTGPKGSQKRKRKSVPPPMPAVNMNNHPDLTTTTTSLLTSPIPTLLTPKSETGAAVKEASSIYSPLFGVSNAYFLANTGAGVAAAPPTPTSAVPVTTLPHLTPDPTVVGQLNKDKLLLNDIPNLLAQTPLHPGLISAIASQTSQTPISIASLLPPLIPSSLTMTATAATSTPPRSSLSSSSPSGSDGDAGSSSGGPTKAKKSKKSSQQKGCPPLTDPAGNRKYKQYTEETLQQALKDVAEGQSINRSSVKYNIPARTLRDWMKRMNIKSVFTHNNGSVKSESGSLDSRNPSMESNDALSIVSNGELSITSSDQQMQVTSGGIQPSMVISAFPGMTVPLQVVQETDAGPKMKCSEDDSTDDEEEIDDDEDGIDAGPSSESTMAAATV